MGRKKWSWQLASVEDIAEKICEEGTGGVRTQVAHYKSSDNRVMLDRISKARKLAELWKLKEQVRMLEQELEGM